MYTCMYMCLYACIYMCVCACISALAIVAGASHWCVHTCGCICMTMYVCTYLYVCVCVCVCVSEKSYISLRYIFSYVLMLARIYVAYCF